MDNYVLLYHFDDHGSQKVVEQEINSRFFRLTVEENGKIKYFGFADKEEPGGVDKLNTILNRVGIGTKDYIALYSSKEKDNDDIKRRMLTGHDTLVENELTNVSPDAHRNSLTKLLDMDYVKQFPNP